MVNVVPGTREDARWQALAANADRRRVVLLALEHPKEVGMGGRRAGQHCAVHRSTVGAICKELEASGEIQEIGARTVPRGGSTYTMDPSGIGKRAWRPSPATRGSLPGAEAQASPLPGESDVVPGPGRQHGGDSVEAPASRSMGAAAASLDGSTGGRWMRHLWRGRAGRDVCPSDDRPDHIGLPGCGRPRPVRWASRRGRDPGAEEPRTGRK